jgi:hypothetical protein
MTPEGRVKAAVKRVLKGRGVWYYMPIQNGMGVTGIPDFIGCQPVTISADMVGQTVGLFIAVETKAPGKRSNVSANQQARIQEIEAASGRTLVVDDAEQLDLFLSGTN